MDLGGLIGEGEVGGGREVKEVNLPERLPSFQFLLVLLGGHTSKSELSSLSHESIEVFRGFRGRVAKLGGETTGPDGGRSGEEGGGGSSC